MFSMYYRLLFNINISNPLLSYIDSNYTGLQKIVLSNLRKINELSRFEVSEDETAYVTAIIAGSVRYNTTSYKSLTGVVVCPYGMSISQLLRLELKKYFPKIKFLEGISVSELQEIDKEHIDIIFSTVPLKTNKPVFLIDSNLEKINFEQLSVSIGKLFPTYFNYREKQIEQLMDAVKKYTNIQSFTDLVSEFEQVLYQQEEQLDSGKNLRAYLLPDNVYFVNEISSYEKALEILRSSMIENQFISKKYIDELKKIGFDEHIIIKEGIALPHTKKDKFVYSTSISLLKLENPIILKGEKISILILLAADERKQHLRAFEELFTILENDNYLYELQRTKDISSLEKLLREVEVYDGTAN